MISRLFEADGELADVLLEPSLELHGSNRKTSDKHSITSQDMVKVDEMPGSMSFIRRNNQVVGIDIVSEHFLSLAVPCNPFAFVSSFDLRRDFFAVLSGTEIHFETRRTKPNNNLLTASRHKEVSRQFFAASNHRSTDFSHHLPSSASGLLPSCPLQPCAVLSCRYCGRLR